MITYEVIIKAHLTRPDNERIDPSQQNVWDVAREVLEVSETRADLVEVTATPLEPSRQVTRPAPQPVGTSRATV